MRPVYFFCLALTVLATSISHAQNIHVFSVIETSNARRPDRLHDVEKLRRIADNVARYGNYTQYWYDFGDSATFTAQHVRLTLEQLRLRSAEKDIIWFYFSGLGHSDGERAWPTLHLNGSELPMRDVIALLRTKVPRTLLVTVDCGNGDAPPVQLISNQVGDAVSDAAGPRLVAPVAVKPVKTQVPLSDVPPIQLVDNYHRLFRAEKLRQVVLISSATRGQRSYSEPTRGSVWLQAFDRSMTEAVSDQNELPSWSGIHKQFTRYTQERTKNLQTPGFSRETTSCCEDDKDF